MSGYDLHREIKESRGFFWQESAGQIYPTLKEMERACGARLAVASRE